MIKRQINISIKIIAFFLISIKATGADIQITETQLQSLTNPSGIDIQKPFFSWQWNTGRRNSFQTGYQILVSSTKENLKKGIGDIWNSGMLQSEKQNYISFNGKKLLSGQTYYWKVRIRDDKQQESGWSDDSFFIMGILDSKEWKAKWISFDSTLSTSNPIFRKIFSSGKKIKTAIVHISGLGYYELYVNNEKTGDHVLDPGQTNYDDYALYVTYDISRQIRNGKNCLSVWLGNGWYNQDEVWGAGGFSYGKPKMICQLDIVYEDGNKAQIVSDESWKWANGPVTRSNVYGGESYDARKELDCLSSAEKTWMPVQLVKRQSPGLKAQSYPAISRIKELSVQKISKLTDGKYIFDFGQNFAGWTKLKINAASGTEITIRTAEEINSDGSLNPASTGVFATNVVQTEKYICKGSGIEIWEPRFTYHGFRYAEVSGLKETPPENLLTGIVVYSSVPENGKFQCSDEQFNYMHQIAIWTLISNLHGIPTDCPTREKCGWLGDAHAIAPMSIYNLGMEKFWIKYLFDIRSSSKIMGKTVFYKTWDDQKQMEKPKGIPFMIAPGKRDAGIATPDWGTALVQIPWYLYLYYGNSEVLKEFYPDMKTWTNYVDSMSVDDIVNTGLGDWCTPGSVVPTEPPMPFTSTAFYYLDLSIMHNTAIYLGLKTDADHYYKRMQAVRQAFISRFYDKEIHAFNSQTANAMALDFGLVPDGEEKKTSDQIAWLSEKKFGNFLNTGIFGLSRIFKALSRYGNETAAFNIITKKGYNSFDFMRNQNGATTLWEILPTDSFYLKQTDKGWERTHNHPMQGGYDAWFYEEVLGIRPDEKEPGFKSFYLEPEMCNQIEWATGEYKSKYGLIRSHWVTKGKLFNWDISIPANTRAKIRLPSKLADHITEGGKPVLNSTVLRLIKKEGNSIVIEAGSGDYSFSVLTD